MKLCQLEHNSTDVTWMEPCLRRCRGCRSCLYMGVTDVFWITHCIFKLSCNGWQHSQKNCAESKMHMLELGTCHFSQSTCSLHRVVVAATSGHQSMAAPFRYCGRVAPQERCMKHWGFCHLSLRLPKCRSCNTNQAHKKQCHGISVSL